MAIGLIGRKCGMTRVFTEAGTSVPVTVVEVSPNRITQLKDDATDGYNAVQITVGERRASRVTKPMAGHYKQAGVEAGRGLWEFRLDDGEALPAIKTLVEAAPAEPAAEGEDEAAAAAEPQYDERPAALGDAITVDMVFAEGQIVDVSGTSIGKGFAGGIKRHNFSHQRNSHGNSLSHRAPGSIGQNQTPGRVFKGKKMAGHMGNVRRTVQNLEVVRVDAQRNLLLIKGGVPGAKGGDLIILPAIKK
jgi:large subunit ribosomal protein L3